MNNFFKSFFAALLALIVFSGIGFVILIVLIAVVSSKQKTTVDQKSVLVVDLSNHFPEIEPSDAFAELTGSENSVPPSLYHLTRLIRYSKYDEKIKGIYIKSDNNENSFASSEEIRDAILDFKSSGKFVYAYAYAIPQRAYYVASTADKIYCAPAGEVEWHGFSMTLPFIKGTLEKLEIEPQIFYAGKFKSATEPLRETQMTEANRLQSNELLGDIYGHFLSKIGEDRKIDTATLHRYADSNAVQFASAALKYKFVDGLKYDDEVKDEIKGLLKIDKSKKISFISPSKYAKSVDYMNSGDAKIALIYAEGNIVDGKGDRGRIGGETYRDYIRKARLDNSIKAIVLRINSGGGSVSASEIMWREVVLARKVKPVIVSFGDVAASGGYYMSCAADSIFAQPNTITGSIGVFGILPNLEKFFNNKLGVTFDEVKTSPDAGFFTVTKPLTPSQKQYFQNTIDTIYVQFKQKVAGGRKKSMEFVDSIAQGRVWSGTKAVEIGLVDRIGSLDDAIAAAAAKAGVKSYWLKEYPGKPGLLEAFLGDKAESSKESAIREELGAEAYKTYTTIRNLKQFMGTAQARLPFEMIIE
jgi:protease-4